MTATTTDLPLIAKGETTGLDFTGGPLSDPTPLTVTFSPRSQDPGQTFT
jgi:hypothetical protein